MSGSGTADGGPGTAGFLFPCALYYDFDILSFFVSVLEGIVFLFFLFFFCFLGVSCISLLFSFFFFLFFVYFVFFDILYFMVTSTLVTHHVVHKPPLECWIQTQVLHSFSFYLLILILILFVKLFTHHLQ